jgi:hypothetical protein
LSLERNWANEIECTGFRLQSALSRTAIAAA